jgi:hypothetical protein
MSVLGGSCRSVPDITSRTADDLMERGGMDGANPPRILSYGAPAGRSPWMIEMIFLPSARRDLHDDRGPGASTNIAF